MANYRNDFADVNLETGTICRNFMNHSIGSGDALGDRFGVRVFRNGEPVSLGGTVAGYFVRNTTGETVVISSGVVSGNEAYVTLPAACYAVEGSFTLAIKVTSGSETVTMRIVDGVVSRTNTSVTVDPGTLVPSIETLISAINSAVGQIPVNYNASFAPAYSASSTYAVGEYVVYDGYLWRCTTAITETESWTAAHWTKVALASDVSDLKSAIDYSINKKENIDFSTASTRSGRVATNDKWNTASGDKSYYFNVSDLKQIIVTAGTATAVICLCKSSTLTANQLMPFATGISSRILVSAGETQIISVPSDCIYITVTKAQGTQGVDYTPASMTFVYYKIVPEVDPTLTKVNAAAEAKGTGDQISAINNIIGQVVTESYEKPSSGNAAKNFLYPVVANQKLYVICESDGASSSSSFNLYTRETSSGSNVETLLSNKQFGVLYNVTTTSNANYLRIVATRSGTISVYKAGTIISDVKDLKNDVSNLSATVDDMKVYTPFVKFDFNPTLYDPSEILSADGEIGVIANWTSKAEALTKVHAAFDALCASGGAGYGYGERVTGLYKEDESDTALLDILAPDYVVNGVTQGDTVTLNIGTDSSSNPVTYNYTYESSTDPYEVRLYKFHDTNAALHTGSVDIPKKKILLIGGTHGNEFCAPINLYILAKHLCSDYTNPDVLKLRSSFDVYIIPYLNGFGCQYRWNNNGTMSTGTRSNGHLVDINRNCYTAGWSGASGTAEQITAYFENNISNLATNTFPGPSNGSEFEGQLVKGLIELLEPDVVIDHHHNSGNPPFYTTCRGNYAGNLVYQAANDTAYARLKNMPQYYGTKYNLFLASDVSPATKAAANGHMQTMAYELGVKMNAVSEMPESIAYLNGVVDSTTKTATKYSADAFKINEYTLLNVILHFCQWALEH